MPKQNLQLPHLAPSATGKVWQHQLELMLESTGEGIFGIDLDGQCMFINRAGAKMLGYEVTQVLGQNMHALTHHSHADGSHYPDTACPIFNAFRRSLSCRIDTEVFWRSDRSAFAVEYSSYPIMEDGQVLGAVITFVDITERKQAANALQRAKEELEQRVAERTQELSVALEQMRELSAHAEKVREEERTRIAREVHDELGSLLVALKMDVNWLDKRLGHWDAKPSAGSLRVNQERETVDLPMRLRMRGKCQHMSLQIEQAVDNVGRIITALRPSILDHQGLWAALEWQAQEFANSAEIELDWQMLADDKIQVAESEAIGIFRIFQEMLSNVGRHAQASRVQVQISTRDGHLHLRVQDNGRGASRQALEAADAWGIMGMRERALQLQGRLEVQSELGQGSRFELIMALRNDEINT
jgi:PAS domain S-box-containing protein